MRDSCGGRWGGGGGGRPEIDGRLSIQAARYPPPGGPPGDSNNPSCTVSSRQSYTGFKGRGSMLDWSEDLPSRVSKKHGMSCLVLCNPNSPSILYMLHYWRSSLIYAFF